MTSSSPPARPRPRRRTLIALASLALIASGAAVAPSAGASAGSDAEATISAPAQPVVGAPALDSHGCARIEDSLPHLTDWPKVESRLTSTPALEAQVKAILAKMTLAEKVGQMTQPEISAITPAQVKEFHIGSVLNGGGSWPGADKHATQDDWLALADAFWQASLTSNAQTRIPVMWGIDAVHGNNNVYGATLYPHNIGLGATKDPCLVRDIGEATAKQIRSTGQDWAFSPTLAVVQDDRWGRTYEGYSEDPRITRAYGYEAITGLQGSDKHKVGQANVLATAKHFIGDGGTTGGKDQGVTAVSEDVMRNVHAQGYYGALAAGVQTVMVSFNSWTSEADGINEGKLHGSGKAMNQILKQKMGFDGLVVSDWNGIGQVPGCTSSSCPRAINAGIDIVMVPNDWQAFIASTIAQVGAGEIPMARIDDAVTRILRVKLRAGIMTAKKPSLRRFASSSAALINQPLARRAVRESMVLLKNNGNVLPLSPKSKVLVVGKSADSMANQTGGWTLSWQGTGNSNSDFPTGSTILAGLTKTLGASDVTYSATGEGVDPSAYDAVIAVIGETPYAEGVGDIGRRSLEAASLHPEDLAVLDRVSGKGAPVVTVYVSGRPLEVNKELNRSDAFVAAWLPGTEGIGVADLLVKGRYTGKGFTGKLSYSWPATACQTPLNAGQADYAPLFPLGYGMSNGQVAPVAALDETPVGITCGSTGGGGTATEDLSIFDRTDVAPYKAFIGSPDNWAGTEVGDDVNAVVSHTNISVSTSDVNVQQDARKVTFNGTGPAQFYYNNTSGPADLRSYLNANSALVFDTIVTKAPTARVVLSAHCVYPCITELEGTKLLTDLAGTGKQTVKIPLACFAASGTLDFENIDNPFLIYTEGALQLALANVRWVPGAGADPDARTCASLT